MILKGCKYGMIRSDKITKEDDVVSVLIEIIEKTILISNTDPELINMACNYSYANIINFNYRVESLMDELIEEMFSKDNITILADLLYASDYDSLKYVYEYIKEITHNSKLSVLDSRIYGKIISDISDILRENNYYDEPLLPGFY